MAHACCASAPSWGGSSSGSNGSSSSGFSIGFGGCPGRFRGCSVHIGGSSGGSSGDCTVPERSTSPKGGKGGGEGVGERAEGFDGFEVLEVDDDVASSAMFLFLVTARGGVRARGEEAVFAVGDGGAAEGFPSPHGLFLESTTRGGVLANDTATAVVVYNGVVSARTLVLVLLLVLGSSA